MYNSTIGPKTMLAVSVQVLRIFAENLVAGPEQSITATQKCGAFGFRDGTFFVVCPPENVFCWWSRFDRFRLCCCLFMALRGRQCRDPTVPGPLGLTCKASVPCCDNRSTHHLAHKALGVATDYFKWSSPYFAPAFRYFVLLVDVSCLCYVGTCGVGTITY